MSKANKMWGGRFSARPDDVMQQINALIDVDVRLWKQDIAGSKAHCEMLVKQKIISKDDGEAILKGLGQIAGEIENGTFEFKTELEDIHMNIESRLREIIGDAAGKLHTARSRNDQVATDFRMWIREAIDVLAEKIEELQDVLENIADAHKDTVMPGFTHLQPAQPVTLAMHMEAYAFMINRDKLRLRDCQGRANKCPLGSAAMAGTPFPVDRDNVANSLGFDRPTNSTMDGVAARDFATEFLFDCAQAGLHLSRLAEEIIIWATPQFGFIKLSDEWSTGSSIMPQKRNPDAAELVRSKTGRLTGNLVTLMTVMKGLPMTYNKDLQEDKEPVFDSFDTLSLCIDAMKGMLETAEFNTGAMQAAAEQGFTTATALADWLVMNLDIPFRDAHHITGQIVKMAEDKGCKLHELDIKDLQSVESGITEDIYSFIDIKKNRV